MRGKAEIDAVAPLQGRITPAYAGKRRAQRVHLPLTGDHPRICGEKLLSAGKQNARLGSPPHMRGKAPPLLPHHVVYGITPAYAGKRSPCQFVFDAVKDHPRICGEKPTKKEFTFGKKGSPPHMRGKVHQHDARPARKGITPAYAGKSMRISEKVEIEVGSPPHMRGKAPRRAFHADHREDHPRICGEKISSPALKVVRMGSPPHMRGKEKLCKLHRNGTGITPAYAGKSLNVHRNGQLHRDHPRICGEKDIAQGMEYCKQGSPPHMRGKETGYFGVVILIRITPAYAGKSFRLVLAFL
mgnify:CR=1 FL=1